LVTHIGVGGVTIIIGDMVHTIGMDIITDTGMIITDME
jgi:hypothetical protein